MAPCNPPLNFVPNGPPGKLPIAPVDPSPPLLNNQPTFTDLATSLLDDLATAGDGFDSEVALAGTAQDAIDAAQAAADASLETILLLLDDATDMGAIDSAANSFAADQPSVQQMAQGVAGELVPSPGQLPLVTPSGQVAVNLGAPPEQGGGTPAGAASYLLHVPLAWQPALASGVGLLGIDGVNDVILGVDSIVVAPDAQGVERYTALVRINPVRAGAFNGTLHVAANVNFLGSVVRVTNNVPFTAIVEG